MLQFTCQLYTPTAMHACMHAYVFNVFHIYIYGKVWLRYVFWRFYSLPMFGPLMQGCSVSAFPVFGCYHHCHGRSTGSQGCSLQLPLPLCELDPPNSPKHQFLPQNYGWPFLFFSMGSVQGTLFAPTGSAQEALRPHPLPPGLEQGGSALRQVGGALRAARPNPIR